MNTNVTIIILLILSLEMFSCSVTESGNIELKSDKYPVNKYQSDLEFEGLNGYVSEVDYFEYNESGKLRDNKTNFYNSFGYLDSTYEKLENGSVISKMVYQRDSIERIVLVKNYSSQGNFVVKKYDYSNSSNAKVEYFLQPKSKEADGSMILKYDEDGILKSIIDNEASGVVFSTNYLHHSNFIEKSILINQNTLDSTVSYYDKGNLKSVRTYKSGNLSVEQTYNYEKFDHKNNWVDGVLTVSYIDKREVFKSSISRKIKYF